MEITNTIEARGKQNIPSPAGVAMGQTKAKPAAQTNTDRLTLSPEAQKKLTEQQAQTADTAQQMKEQMEVANAKAKAQTEVMDNAGKCMTIASRIMAGDTVPRNDESFLAKNDSKLYMMAISMRRQKETPQKYRSITEEEGDGAQAVQSASGEVTQNTETPPTTEGGERGDSESGESSEKQ